MADYALGLNATGARVSSGDCKLLCKAELESDGPGFNWLDVCDVQLCRHLSHFPEGLGGANSRGEAKIKCHLRGDFRQMALVG